jgi:ubiquinone/menaquinone biosynthesis C-methylase UbiE
MNSTNLPYQIFNDSWNLYKKVVDADYMHHQLFNRLTLEAVDEIKKEHPLQMLDIGCGDATPVLSLLENTPLESYTGYDLSEVALRACAANLSFLNRQVILKQGDMSTLLDQEERSFDLIFSSYAIHHLEDLKKSGLFKKITSKLKPEGRFIYIDIYREEGQTLELYRESYTEYILQWDAIDSKEKSAVIEHISQFDLPSTLSDMKDWFSEAGMKIIRMEKGDDRHIFLSLERA